MLENKFKQSLKGHDPLWGLWLGLPDTSCAEICGSAGFDWVLIDGEHASFDLTGIKHHLQALAAHSASPIVRAEDSNPTLIKRLLDIGAQTVLVPMVNDANEAEQVVKSALYPPLGHRGIGSALARASQWNRVPQYLHRANEQICILVQVETKQAIDNIEAIAAVEGIDGIFIGPSDLSGSMGHIGNPSHPEVVAAIDHAIEVIQHAGKATGILSLNPQQAREYAARGVKFIGAGVDTLLLRLGAEQLAYKLNHVDDIETPVIDNVY
ncbi:4-hydroxy-2-oxoheptanedioate aldolase [Vibrio mediterranei]|jgi:4-hydroxy-2-oxoheptanedioate aldolase|uniref:4-hydroxy-2-oxoheptanedioate aldolase n=1 Tax=Vibrio TaxID=662 RepID=UPI001818E0EB|nr:MULTISPECIES: 4-hydroxy-2-oxoheptanedioate aldolase [Vibrio]MCF4174204.1 4-hydroxy-2-oxoheptanedioate aldolase [Vibrio sp. McD22-P3]MCG9625789.1 4-hydroxy-2-oxoheptanedioate aldolase [Vibrio mediterranei]MCG9659902.1 4-hydroxy-2-oxoheptanedioate aldolase [Vibrio mediterranei]MCG9662809.1 4-hydroxy-2-oxoheptanedioate aldolase [Vibrio mediterranei]MCY9854716.1 4-hydroxy-2-oxoheptanedioate aldolase [Vibrio mediterranei]